MDKLYKTAKIETDTENCPNCGGTLVYSPNQGKLQCEYCASMIDFEKKLGIDERELEELFSQNNLWTETEVYRCNNCGAKEVVSKNEISKQCPFCGTTNVVKTEELSGIKPHGVVPFRLTNLEAAAVARKWLKTRFFAPKKFKESAAPQKIHGVYNPVFTFDSKTVSTYEGRLGEHYTVTSTRNGKTVTETKTRYFYVKGSYNGTFDDLLVQGSERITQQTLNAIEPFPTNDANEYSSKFMTGFVANQYSIDGKTCFVQAKKEMDARIRRAILSKYHHDTVSYLNVNTTYHNLKFKYVLIPVYIGHTDWKTKLYHFYVNGYHGKITGNTPVSGWKVTMIVLLVLAVLFCIIVLPILLSLGSVASY